MRTTLTLDDDVAAQLQQLRAREDKPFKQLVNEALRAGLAQRSEPETRPQGPFTRPVDLGRPLLGELDDVSATLTVAEGDAHR